MSSILPLPHAVVGEFVGTAHRDLQRMSELLAAYPTVIHASFDWGNGDFESAIGAAAHSGRRDIVEYLVNKGARLDIYAAAFLGRLSLVKAFLHESPNAVHQPGPHGISLLDHAKKGGNADMVAYLRKLLEPEKAARARSLKSSAKHGKPKRRKAA